MPVMPFNKRYKYSSTVFHSVMCLFICYDDYYFSITSIIYYYYYYYIVIIIMNSVIDTKNDEIFNFFMSESFDTSSKENTVTCLHAYH